MMTLVAATAVAEGIREVTGLDTGIKWPNDIVADGKKICGILTEMSSDMDSIHYVIVGIGINVGKQEFPEEIRETATSLELCTGHAVDRAKLVDAVLRGWEQYYEIFLRDLDLSGLMEEYNRMLVNMNREVRVLAPKGDYTGISHGITKTGELIVELPDGERREVMSGEVSVRGVYGYV
jgi:BirA family biotin operon repressor/biotin-[acetyl-CoA-carboxylase] ligase